MSRDPDDPVAPPGPAATEPAAARSTSAPAPGGAAHVGRKTRPSGRPADVRALREALGKARKARPRDPSQPEWRQRLDAIVDDAVGQVIEQGVVSRPDGRVDVVFDRKLAASHGLPALTAILDGVRDGLAGAGLPAADSATGPLGAMTAALRQNLVGLVENVRTGLAGEPPPPRPDAVSASQSPPPSMPDPREVMAGLLARAAAQVPPVAAAPAAPASEQPSSASDGRRPAPTVSLDVAGLLGSLLGGLQRATARGPGPDPAPGPTRREPGS